METVKPQTQVVCNQCGALDSFDGIRVDEMSDEHQDGGLFVCRECGHESGTWINAK